MSLSTFSASVMAGATEDGPDARLRSSLERSRAQGLSFNSAWHKAVPKAVAHAKRIGGPTAGKAWVAVVTDKKVKAAWESAYRQNQKACPVCPLRPWPDTEPETNEAFGVYGGIPVA